MIVFILLSLLLGIFVSWLSFIKDFKRCNLKGPLAAPLVGYLPLCFLGLEDILDQLNYLREKFGDAFQLYILSNRYIILHHPKYFDAVLSGTKFIVKGLPYNNLMPWLGNGLLTSNETIMGVAVNAQKDTESEYVKAVHIFSKTITRQTLNLLLGIDLIFRLTPYKKQRDEAVKILHKQSYDVINMRIKELKEMNITIENLDKLSGFMNKNAFLDLLLLAEIDGETMDLESVREEVDTFMFAGHDTTTTAAVFILYCISQHEHVQKKLLEEQVTILGDDINKEPNNHELKLMKYLEAVVKETLRLYPPVPFIARKVENDTDLLGSHLPEGSSLVLNIFGMQRHPDVYENPLEFRTDRFDENKGPYSWVAFGAGTRNCIGQKFAMMEIKTIIGSIVRNFKILPVDGALILQPTVILRSKNTISIKLLPRK